MALDYVALILLIVIIVLVVYGVIAVWGIPYEIAKGRHHPHQDAIGAATWVSLFTLGALWPFLWIWAMAYRPDRGWGFSHNPPAAPPPDHTSELEILRRRLSELEGRLQKESK
jgi:type VI protein secretion system component VasK